MRSTGNPHTNRVLDVEADLRHLTSDEYRAKRAAAILKAKAAPEREYRSEPETLVAYVRPFNPRLNGWTVELWSLNPLAIVGSKTFRELSNADAYARRCVEV